MPDSPNKQTQGGTSIEESYDLDHPRQYKVLLHNDDYTPMEFVVEVLMNVFGKDEMTAMQIMLNVHHLGAGTCGVYPYEIAETKVARVHDLAEKNEHPLRASMEEE